MNINLDRWMEALPGDISVSAVSIPGTHNSASASIPLGLICRCQDTTIQKQLEFGVRMLDIRLELCPKGFKAVHSIVDCRQSRFGGRLYFDEIFSSIKSFLRENPSEAVFMLLSEDDKSSPPLPFWDSFYHKYIMPFKDVWFCKNRIPILSECRGRIVLMRRAPFALSAPPSPFTSPASSAPSSPPAPPSPTAAVYDDKNTGLNLESWGKMGCKKVHSPVFLDITSVTNGSVLDTAKIQDRYTHSPKSKWRNVISPMLDSADSFGGALTLNYMSTAGGFFSPYFNARYINSRFSRRTLNKQNFYGWFVFDFACADLCKKIILLNF